MTRPTEHPDLDALEPCPFCGCTMRIESNRDWHKAVGNHSTRCILDSDSPPTVSASADQLELLVRDWNTRSSPPNIGEVPTEDMIIAGMEASVLGRSSMDDDSYVLSIWNAMCAAAPHPQQAPTADITANQQSDTQPPGDNK